MQFSLLFSPGLNHCNISEDETTAAVQALATGVTAIPTDFGQNHQKFPSDRIKQKLKKRQTSVGTNPLRSHSQMQILQPELENGSLKDVKPSLTRVNFTNQINMVNLNKRKGEPLVGGTSFVYYSYHFRGWLYFSLLMDGHDILQLIQTRGKESNKSPVSIYRRRGK